MSEENGNRRKLSDSDLFAGFSAQDRDQLMRFARRVEVRKGEILVNEGEKADSLFLLSSGELEVSVRDGRGADVVLARVVEPGSFLGEMSILDPAPRSATIRAGRPSVVFELTRDQLERFFGESPRAESSFFRNIARTLVRRLREANRRLAAAGGTC